MMHEDNRAARARMGQGGITLIELLVTVAILAILAAVAVPSYMAYYAQARRADAEAVLQENAQFLERNYTTANRYDIDSAGSAVDLPYDQSPQEGTKQYDISLASAAVDAADPDINFPASGQQGYTLIAVPVSADDCGTLILDQTGRRGVTGAGATVDECWKQ